MGDIAGIGGLAGGVVGAIGGTIAGAIQARALNKDAAKLRKNIRKGIAFGQLDTARQTGGVLRSSEYRTGSDFIRQFFGLGPLTDPEISGRLRDEFGYARGQDLRGLGGSQIAGFTRRETESLNSAFESNYVGSSKGLAAINEGRAFQGQSGIPNLNAQMGGGTAFDTLTGDFLKGIRQAQSIRGLYSSEAGASAEASGLAAFRANLQLQLLPQLLQMADTPGNIRRLNESGNIGRQVFSQSGGRAVYGQQNQGAFGVGSTLGYAFNQGASAFGAGASIGTNIGGQFDQQNFLNQLLANQGGQSQGSLVAGLAT